MKLFKIDQMYHPDPKDRNFAEALSRTFRDFQILVMRINNECIELRKEVESLKQEISALRR